MKTIIPPLALLLAGLMPTASPAQTAPLRNPGAAWQMLSGTRLEGLYLRTNSPYHLIFHRDGSLENQRGARGHWWINAEGQYCRRWENGRLAGHQACFDLVPGGEEGRIAIHFKGKRVAQGRLRPIQEVNAEGPPTTPKKPR